MESVPCLGQPVKDDMSGDEMTTIMRKLGWSAHELARRLDVRPQTVTGWTSSRRPIPPNLAEWLEQWSRLADKAPPLPRDWKRDD